jgi:NAD(P)-dependent dehydrogenase (short-subunit alcohol dehydrogenase family)
MEKKIWFITGISSGLGQALAEAVINEGHFVIGTFRQQLQADIFNNKYKEDALGIVLDITDGEKIEQTFDFVAKKFKKIDFLVNNAGFGFAGAIEETTEKEIREVFEANFFGTWQVTKSALPILRTQKSGHIIQISSHGGVKAFAGFGIYNASKFALEGMSEALAAEVAPLGIKLTIVEPGPFRTNFAGDAFRQAANVIADYQQTAGVFRERMSMVNGKQEGSPEKAADAIIKIAALENPPLRLPLGKIALVTIGSKIDSIKKDLDDWATLSATAVYEG